MHEFITNQIDPLLQKLSLELDQDDEIQKAYMEAQRAENMIKHKAEILSKPKAEWHTSKKEK